MTPRSFAAAIATVVLLAGLWALLWPVSVAGPERDRLACGDGGLAASVPVTYPEVDGGTLAYDMPLYDPSRPGVVTLADDVSDHRGPVYFAAPWTAACAEALAARWWAWPAVLAGGVVVLGAVVVRRDPVRPAAR